MSMKITIIDYGVGNLLSVQRAFEHCGAVIVLAHSPQDIAAAERLVLPGVGAFADGMAELRKKNLVGAVRDFARSGRPLLGICLGMQMLASVSEEFGEHEGLDIIPGRVRVIPRETVDGRPLKSPHIGWSDLHTPAGGTWDNSILSDTPALTSVYLVHSYAVDPDNPADVLAQCEYGGQRVTSAIRYGNVFGCQFHPEKSGPAGLRMLANFVARPLE